LIHNVSGGHALDKKAFLSPHKSVMVLLNQQTKYELKQELECRQ